MASRLAARNGGPAGLAALAVILLLGLGLRLDYAWEGRAPVFDAAAYERIAANLERGDGFTVGPRATQPASNYSPGVPLLVAGLYELAGGVHKRFARVALALLGALSVLFAHLIGRRLSGPAAGLIGAAAVAVYPALLEYQGMLMGEPLASTLLSGAVLAMLWATGSNQSDSRVGGTGGGGVRTGESANPPSTRDRTRAPRWLVPGLLLGALALVRPEYVGIAVLLGAVVFLASPHIRNRGEGPALGPSAEGLKSAVLLLVGVAVVVAPWTVRNAVALDRFVPVSTGGGQVLFAGAYIPSGGDPERVGREVLERHPRLALTLALRYLPRSAWTAPGPVKTTPSQPDRTRSSQADGGVRPTPPIDEVLAEVRLEQILAALAAQRYPELETDRALGRMGRERLWDNVTERPLGYSGFIAAKVARAWFRGPRDVMRRLPWEILHWALLGLGLLGLGVLAQKRRWEALLLGTVLLSLTAVAALLVASPRRVLVTVPLLAALAGVGSVFLATRLSQGRHLKQGRLLGGPTEDAQRR